MEGGERKRVEEKTFELIKTKLAYSLKMAELIMEAIKSLWEV